MSYHDFRKAVVLEQQDDYIITRQLHCSETTKQLSWQILKKLDHAKIFIKLNIQQVLLDRSSFTRVMWLWLYRFYCSVASLSIQSRFYCSVRLWNSCIQQDNNLSDFTIFWCLHSRKIFIHAYKWQDQQVISKFNTSSSNQVWKSEIFSIQIK